MKALHRTRQGRVVAGAVLLLAVLGLAVGWSLLGAGPSADSGDSLEPQSAETKAPQGNLEPSALRETAGASRDRQQAALPTEVSEPTSASVDFGDALLQEWSGQVLASRSGEPVSGAEVEVRFAAGTLLASTDEAGLFQVQAPEGIPCVVAVRAEGYAPRVRPQLVTGPMVTILLIEAGAIYGTYRPFQTERPGSLHRDPSQLVAQLFLPQAQPYSDPFLEVPLDAEGRFRFEPLEPGVYSVSLGPGIFAVAKEIAVGPGQAVEAKLSMVESRFRVSGQVVVNPGGEPLADAEVEVRFHALGVPAVLERDARETYRTGPDGKVEFWVAEGMRTGLRITAPWGGLFEVGYLDPADWRKRSGQVWKIDAPARLSGKVWNEADEGVPGVRVRIDRGVKERRSRQAPVFETHSWARGLNREVTTGPDGRFDFGEVPARYQLVVVAEPLGVGGEAPFGDESVPDVSDWAGARANVFMQPGEEKEHLTLRVNLIGTLNGLVVDQREQPWPGVSVTLLDRLGQKILRTRTDSEGRFQLRKIPVEPRRNVHLHFEDGERWLGSRSLRFPDREAAEKDAQGLAKSFTLEERYQFDRTLLVRGYVLDDEDYGIPGVRVILRRLSGPKRNRVSVETDAQGAFAIYRDWGSPSKIELRIYKPGWSLRGVDKLVLDSPYPDPWLVRVAPESALAPATLRGEVLLGNTNESIPRLRIEGLRGVLTTQGSRFALAGIEPGRYRPRIRTPGFEYMTLPAVDLSPGAVVDVGTLRIGRGTDLTVEVRGQGRKNLPRNARVRLVHLSSPEERPDLKGRRIGLRSAGIGKKGPRLRAMGVPRGRWRLVVTVPGYERIEKPIGLHKRRVNVSVDLKRKASQDKEGR